MAVINLKTIPIDLLKFILKTQGEIKSDKSIGQFSLEQTVYKIIKDLKEIKEKEKSNEK